MTSLDRSVSPGGKERRASSSRSRERKYRPRSQLSGPSGMLGSNKEEKRPPPIKLRHSDSSANEQENVGSFSEPTGRGSQGLALTRIGEDTIPDMTSEKDEPGLGRREHKRSRFRLSLDMRSNQSRTSTEDVRNKLLPPISISELKTDARLSGAPESKPMVKSFSLPTGNGSMVPPSDVLTTLTATTTPSRASLVAQRSVAPTVPKPLPVRKARKSLPASLHASKINPAHMKKEEPELKERSLNAEYAHKRE